MQCNSQHDHTVVQNEMDLNQESQVHFPNLNFWDIYTSAYWICILKLDGLLLMRLLSRIMSPQLKGVLMFGFIMIHNKHSLSVKQK